MMLEISGTPSEQLSSFFLSLPTSQTSNGKCPTQSLTFRKSWPFSIAYFATFTTLTRLFCSSYLTTSSTLLFRPTHLLYPAPPPHLTQSPRLTQSPAICPQALHDEVKSHQRIVSGVCRLCTQLPEEDGRHRQRERLAERLETSWHQIYLRAYEWTCHLEGLLEQFKQVSVANSL